jgi:uncharacterized protein (DUF1697 family)
MPFAVFLRAVNVGGANLCRPSIIAKQLAKFDVVNIGAVGTFVVRGSASETVLRAAIAKKLTFKCEIMIVPARQVIQLSAKDPFFGQPFGPGITRFASVLAKRPRTLPALPITFPVDADWLFKVIAIENRFVIGLYLRQMKAVGYLGKMEKLLGVPITTRNWNTNEKVLKVLRQG